MSPRILLADDEPDIVTPVSYALRSDGFDVDAVTDGEQALAIACDEARSGDIVLLAGKGHETYQILGDRTIEFDDREKAREILRRKGYLKTSAGR